MIFDEDQKAALCTREFAAGSCATDIMRFIDEVVTSSDASDALERLLDIDVNRYLPDCLLVKVDIATMAHGLEGRSPMLDHHFVEFAASLPSHLKLNGKVTKYILKRAVRELVPAQTIDRPKKGFSVPMRKWLREDLREMVNDVLLDGRLARRGYFRDVFVRRMVDEHSRGVADWRNQLWSLLMFELWHRMFIDQTVSTLVRQPDSAFAVATPRC
jgi:asparagine synthase (glutamine-hydrolysing)